MTDQIQDGVLQAQRRLEERAVHAESDRDLVLASRARWALAVLVLCSVLLFVIVGWALAEFKANAAIARLAAHAWDDYGCR